MVQGVVFRDDRGEIVDSTALVFKRVVSIKVANMNSIFEML